MQKTIIFICLIVTLICNIAYASIPVPLSDVLKAENYMENFNSIGRKISPQRQLSLKEKKIINNGEMISYRFDDYDRIAVVLYCDMFNNIQDIRILTDRVKEPFVANTFVALETIDYKKDNEQSEHIDLIYTAINNGYAEYWSSNTKRKYQLIYKVYQNFIMLDIFAEK